jgi:hypothetical protein
MRRHVLWASALLLIAPAAHAAPESGGRYDGRTLGSGGGGVFVEAGWPGFGAGVLFGTSDGVDVGLEATALYTGVGTYATEGVAPEFGVDPRIVARFGVVRSERVSFLLRLEPGVRVMAFDPALRWGPEVDFGADFGIHVAPGASVLVGLETPVVLDVPSSGSPFAVLIPILAGAGFEYHTGPFAFGGRFDPGVSIRAGNFAGSPTTSFAFIAQGFFMLRWGQPH